MSYLPDHVYSKGSNLNSSCHGSSGEPKVRFKTFVIYIYVPVVHVSVMGHHASATGSGEVSKLTVTATWPL